MCGPLTPARSPPRSPAATSRSWCWPGSSSAIPLVLLVGQPTRGVDIGAIELIHRRLVAMRDAGKAILLVSAELDEIMGLSDRILVMFGGSIAGEIPADRATEQGLGLLMAGAGTTNEARRAP